VVESEVDERVETRVPRLDAFDRRLEHLDRRQLPPADATREFHDRREGHVSQRHSALLPVGFPVPLEA